MCGPIGTPPPRPDCFHPRDFTKIFPRVSSAAKISRQQQFYNKLLCLPLSCRLPIQMTTTTSPMLAEERRKEEETLKAVLDKQSAAPSWWPAAQGIMSESHYARIRKAEKFLLREERRVTAGCACGTRTASKHDADQSSGQNPTLG